MMSLTLSDVLPYCFLVTSCPARERKQASKQANNISFKASVYIYVCAWLGTNTNAAPIPHNA